MGFLIWSPFGVSSSKVDCRMVLFLMGMFRLGLSVDEGSVWAGSVGCSSSGKSTCVDQWLLAVAVSINQLFFC